MTDVPLPHGLRTCPGGCGRGCPIEAPCCHVCWRELPRDAKARLDKLAAAAAIRVYLPGAPVHAGSPAARKDAVYRTVKDHLATMLVEPPLHIGLAMVVQGDTWQRNTMFEALQEHYRLICVALQALGVDDPELAIRATSANWEKAHRPDGDAYTDMTLRSMRVADMAVAKELK